MSATDRSVARAAIITSNYWPEKTGIGQVTTEFAEFLAAGGVDVRVATAMPYYPEWSIYPSYRRAIWRTERRNEVLIHRAAHYASRNPGTFGRILHEATLCLLSLPNMIRVLRGADAAFVVSPDLSHAFVACLVARLMGVRIILVVQDVMPDAAVEMGLISNKLVIWVSAWLAAKTYELAATITTLSEGMKQRIARRTGNAAKIEVVPNTIDSDELEARPNQGEPFRERFVPKDTISVLHTGNMGEKQDLHLLLRAARRLKDNANIHFYVFGDGAVKREFLRIRDDWGLANVSHFPLQERSLLPHMLYGADICLVTQLPEVVDIVVPSKLITAMGAGAMIVAACAEQSETASLLRASGGGIVVPASDDQAVCDAIIKISLGGVDIPRHRQLVRQFAYEHFSRDVVYRPILDKLSAARAWR